MEISKELIKNTYDYYRFKLKEDIIKNGQNPDSNLNLFNPNIMGIKNLSSLDINVPAQLVVAPGTVNLDLYYENGIQIDPASVEQIRDDIFFDINGTKKIIEEESFETRYNFLSNSFSLEYQDNLDNYAPNYEEQINNVVDDHISNNRFKNFRFFEREIKPTYGRDKVPFYHFNSSERNKFYEFITQKQNVVSILTATTGSGKTTEIPLYLLEFGFSKFNSDKKIIITQPRRVAASNPASYVSKLTDMPRKIKYEDYEYYSKRVSMTKSYVNSIKNIYKFLKNKDKQLNMDDDKNDLNKIINKKTLIDSVGMGHQYNYLVGSEESLIIFTHPTENVYDIIEPKYYIPDYETFILKENYLYNQKNEKFKVKGLETNILSEIDNNGNIILNYGKINKNLYFQYSNDDLNCYIKKNYWDNFNKNQDLITFKINNSRIIEKLNNDEINFKIDEDENYKLGSLSNGFCYYKNDKKKRFYLFQNAFYTNMEIEYECEKIQGDAVRQNVVRELKAQYDFFGGLNGNFEPNIYMGSSYIKLPYIPNRTIRDLNGRNNGYTYNNYKNDINARPPLPPNKLVPVDSNVIYINDLNMVVEPYNTLNKKVQNEIIRIKQKNQNNQFLKDLKFIYDNEKNRGIFKIYNKEKDLNQSVLILKVDGIFIAADLLNKQNYIEFEIFLLEKTMSLDIIENSEISINRINFNFRPNLENNTEINSTFHNNLLPFIRVYENGVYKYKYSKIHRLSNNFKPDINIIDDNNIEIKYYVQFVNEEFSLFNRTHLNNIGFTIIDRYEYKSELKHFILQERVNNKSEDINRGDLVRNTQYFKNLYDNLIGDQIDLYLTFMLKNKGFENTNMEIVEYEIGIFKEETKKLFNISTISLDSDFIKNYEFIDHSLNKFAQMRPHKMQELIKYLEIDNVSNLNKESIIEKVFTHEKIYILKKVLMVLDKNFLLKKFNSDDDNYSSRRFSYFEKKLFEDGNGYFDFYNELIKINNIISNFNGFLDMDLEKFKPELLLKLNNYRYLRNFESYICNFHKVKSNNYDIKSQQTIPIDISSIIGCKYRGLNKITENTRIDFITDGTFEVELYNDLSKNSNFFLDKYSCVLVDEAHERTIPTELIISLFNNKLLDNIKKKGTKEFKFIIMSATINKHIFLDYFNTKYFYHIEGSTKDINIWYHNYKNKSLLDLIKIIINDILSGKYLSYYNLEVKNRLDLKVPVPVKKEVGILIFLPNVQLINTLADDLEKTVSSYKILKLWRDKPEIDSIVNESTEFWSKEDNKNYNGRIIISTDVAETSITPNNITSVIDSGYVFKKFYNPIKKIELLNIIPTSINSMVQRMGRVGRNLNGNYFPIFTQDFYSFNKKIGNSVLKETHTPPIVDSNIKDKVYKLFILNIISSPNDIVSKYNMINKPNFEILKNIVNELHEENLIINKNNFNSKSNVFSDIINLNKNFRSAKVLNYIFENKNYLPYLKEILIMIYYLEKESIITKTSGQLISNYDILTELTFLYNIHFEMMILHNVRETNINDEKSIYNILQKTYNKRSEIGTKEFRLITDILLEDIKNIEKYLKLNDLNNLFYIPEFFSQQQKDITSKSFVKKIQTCIIRGYNELYLREKNSYNYKSINNNNIISLETYLKEKKNIHKNFIFPNYLHISKVDLINGILRPVNVDGIIYYMDEVVNEYLNSII